MVCLPEPSETASLRGLTLEQPCPRNRVIGLRKEVREAVAATVEAISLFSLPKLCLVAPQVQLYT